jgi:uroporphyrinogen-III synthase
MRVIVTRPAAEAAEWVDALQSRGIDAVALPLIEILPAAETKALLQAWGHMGSYRAAMFVSANAVRGLFAVKPADAALPVRAWATGTGTRNALAGVAVPAATIDSPGDDSAQFDSEALWRIVEPQCGTGDRILLVRGGEGRDWLEQRLTEKGAVVETVQAYRRMAPAWQEAQRKVASGAAADTWLFSSSEALRNLQYGLPQQKWHAARAIATHPRIAQAARDAGFGVVCESRPSLDDVIATLESAG